MKKNKIRILMYKYGYIFKFRAGPRSFSPKHYNISKTYSDIIEEKYF